MGKTELDEDIQRAAAIWAEHPHGPRTIAQERAWLEENGVTITPKGPSNDEQVSETDLLYMLAGMRWAWHWAESGFTTLRASHTYAAALMATDPTNQPHDLLLPWRAFRAEVPEGLLSTATLSARWVYVYALDAGADESASVFDQLTMPPAMLAYSGKRLLGHRDELAATRVTFGPDIGDLLWNHSASELDWLKGEPVENDTKTRFMTLVRNYVTGLLYTLQHTQNWRSRETRHPACTFGPRRAPPTHRNVVCGRPIAVDLRNVIREQIERGGPHAHRAPAPAAVQSLVRGHYKRQVIGVGRSGRKVIWVEPYWRGPEEAPIVVRPYTLI